MMNLGRSATSGSGASEQQQQQQQQPGLPVCVCASTVDGYVLALSAFNHSYNYRSAILFGYATLVEDQDEKLYAMELMTNSVVPDRWQHTRLPITGAEMQSTSLLRVRITSGSAKIRDGNASDEKPDLENAELVAKTWTGVLPMHQGFGEPVPSSYCSAEVPPHVTEFTREFSADSKEHSVQAAKDP